MNVDIGWKTDRQTHSSEFINASQLYSQVLKKDKNNNLIISSFIIFDHQQQQKKN